MVFVVRVAICKYFYNCCKNGRRTRRTILCSIVAFVAYLGTNMNVLCLRISLAFVYPCVETSRMSILELNGERMPIRNVKASGIGGAVN